MNITEPTCSDLCRSLCAYVDEELEPGLFLALQAHVDRCEECAARVAFARSSRTSVRSVVKSVTAPSDVRFRLARAVQMAVDDRDSSHAAVSSSIFTSAPMWKYVGPLAGAAALALLWASVSVWKSDAFQPVASVPKTESQASMMPVDTLIDTLVQQHANPLPPETSNPTDIAGFDRFVGVPVRLLSENSWKGKGKLVGARMIPLQDLRAAMFQYDIGNARRVSVYVYNPRRVRRTPSHMLRQQILRENDIPVYVGYVRGYSVAVTDRKGVGYAMTSDLGERETSELLAAMGSH